MLNTDIVKVLVKKSYKLMVSEQKKKKIVTNGYNNAF